MSESAAPNEEPEVQRPQLKITAREKSAADNRCAYCHDEIGVRVAAFCPVCGVRLHTDCLEQIDRCPTIGCDADFGEERRRQRSLAPSWEAVFADSPQAGPRPLKQLEVLRFRDGRSSGKNLGELLNQNPVDLSGLDLRHVNLRRLAVEDALLLHVDLSGAQLDGAHFAGSDLSHALLSGAKLLHARLERTSLRSANLEGADLSGACLQGANLERTELREAVLKGADLRQVQGDHARLGSVNLRGAKLGAASLVSADLAHADLREAELKGADLSRGDLSYARLQGANLTRARLEGGRLTGAKLEGADLSHAQLGGVSLKGADLSAANLRGATLTGADLTGARLTGAQLEGANLSGAKLAGADLAQSGLAGAVLRDATYDKQTAWPKTGVFKRFDPKARGATRT
ncbi:MAG: pentapeptide repeat-containing protein [Planctomycetota bacterium]